MTDTTPECPRPECVQGRETAAVNNHNVQKQVAQCMSYRSAHSFWMAMRIAAFRAGEPFDKREPKLEDFR